MTKKITVDEAQELLMKVLAYCDRELVSNKPTVNYSKSKVTKVPKVAKSTVETKTSSWIVGDQIYFSGVFSIKKSVYKAGLAPKLPEKAQLMNLSPEQNRALEAFNAS